ncbi:MAG: hypothetical protein LBN41_09925 [Enterobacteriaceae bacterium]|jgi:membrane protein|nr:hypothetical protein [Enterobacteriaceae bacterium]
MTKRLKLKFNLHKIVIALFCLALFAVLMQSVSYFSVNNQTVQAKQTLELARTLAKQVTYTLSPLLEDPINNNHNQQIRTILQHLTLHSRILDVSVYHVDGSLIMQEGDETRVKDRLSINETEPNQQIVEMINGKDGPSGFILLTLNTRIEADDVEQMRNTTNMLRLMLVLALVIGMILARTLLAQLRIDWHRSPYFLIKNERPSSAIIAPTDRNNPMQKKKRPHKKKPYH